MVLPLPRRPPLRVHARWRWIGIAASAIATHLGALSAGFIWLDHAHIEGRLAIAPPSQWLGLFTHGFAGTGYYRPLMALSLSIDALIGGGRSAFVFHLTSIVWHAIATLAVAAAAEALGSSRRAATIAALFFAVHPISALTADAIAFRSEAMMTAALLGLVWAHSKKRSWLAALLLLVGALTKETALVLGPLFVVALEVRSWSRSRDDAENEKDPPSREKKKLLGGEALWLTRHALPKVAQAVAFGAAFALRFAYAPAWRASHPELSMGDAIGTRLAGVAKSVAAVLLPIDRSICDAFAVTHVWQISSIAGLIALVALFWGAWKTRARGIALLLALSVLPVLQIVPVARFWSPHYVYLPLAFIAMLLAETLEQLVKGARRIVVATATAIVVLGAITIYDARKYDTDTSLWTPEVAAQPACREGQFYLGEVARIATHWDEAAKRYEASLAPQPQIIAFVDRGAALQNLGVVRAEQHRFGAARAAFREALLGTRDLTTRRELTHDLAAASLSDGDAEEAARLLEEETARSDAHPESILVRAMALEKLGRHDEARELFVRIKRVDLIDR